MAKVTSSRRSSATRFAPSIPPSPRSPVRKDRPQRSGVTSIDSLSFF
jgi:hypothetical protein